MLVKVEINWKSAFRQAYNVDIIKKKAVRLGTSSFLSVIIGPDDAVRKEIKEWLIDNKISSYKLFDVYNLISKTDRIFYHGLAVELDEPDDVVMFKLSFQ